MHETDFKAGQFRFFVGHRGARKNSSASARGSGGAFWSAASNIFNLFCSIYRITANITFFKKLLRSNITVIRSGRYPESTARALRDRNSHPHLDLRPLGPAELKAYLSFRCCGQSRHSPAPVLRLTPFKNGPRFGNHDLAKVWGKIAQARSRVDSDSCLGTFRGKTSLISGKTHRQKLLHEKLASV